jgi:hypothetical protein
MAAEFYVRDFAFGWPSASEVARFRVRQIT